jgi:hypothetical protein
VNRALLISILLASCSGETPPERHELGTLKYAVPAEWTSRDQSEHQTKIVVWTPSPAANARKESIALMRTRELPALTKSSFAYVQHCLSEAQRGLPQAAFGITTRFKTKHGLVGARIEGDFVPAGADMPHRRMHAVVIDGNSLVHVLYTARNARPEAFARVLDSLIRKDT